MKLKDKFNSKYKLFTIIQYSNYKIKNFINPKIIYLQK